eukprot:TRINITY_DN12057_c0_g1_i2.p1 TRINITY_DN12057_c0_g1~~TRINITY_DN12057_c0_g1_i2.p1  ORF type:complete len:1272 (+),score=276.74 TRINITY_DN12057_c0_g1_i2:493-3816(+)
MENVICQSEWNFNNGAVYVRNSEFLSTTCFFGDMIGSAVGSMFLTPATVGSAENCTFLAAASVSSAQNCRFMNDLSVTGPGLITGSQISGLLSLFGPGVYVRDSIIDGSVEIALTAFNGEFMQASLLSVVLEDNQMNYVANNFSTVAPTATVMIGAISSGQDKTPLVNATVILRRNTLIVSSVEGVGLFAAAAQAGVSLCNVILEDMTFVHDSASSATPVFVSGAGFAAGSPSYLQLDVRNCSFECPLIVNNTDSSSAMLDIRITNSTFWPGSGVTALVTANASSNASLALQISECLFSGSGLTVYKAASMEIVSTSFVGAKAALTASATAQLTVASTSFREQSQSAIVVDSCSAVLIQDSSFTSTSDPFNGGALHSTNCIVQVMNTTCTSARSANGACFFANASVLSLQNVTVLNASAWNSGGALMLVNSASGLRGEMLLNISGSHFIDCHAQFGAALFVADVATSTAVSVSETSFENNTASIAGGALYRAANATSVQVGLSEVSCSGNHAANGACIYMESGQQDAQAAAGLNASACIFASNSAVNSGGVLHATEIVNIAIVDSVFSQNTAEIAGGVAMLQDVGSSLLSGTFILNSALCGAIAYANASQASPETASSVSVLCDVCSGNSAQTGSVVSAHHGAHVSVSGHLLDNFAAVNADNDAQVTLVNVVVSVDSTAARKLSQANLSRGAVAQVSNAMLLMINASLNGVQTIASVAAIYAVEGSVVIVDGLEYSNSFGTLLHVVDSDLIISNSFFFGCSGDDQASSYAYGESNTFALFVLRNTSAKLDSIDINHCNGQDWITADNSTVQINAWRARNCIFAHCAVLATNSSYLTLERFWLGNNSASEANVTFSSQFPYYSALLCVNLLSSIHANDFWATYSTVPVMLITNSSAVHLNASEISACATGVAYIDASSHAVFAFCNFVSNYLPVVTDDYADWLPMIGGINCVGHLTILHSNVQSHDFPLGAIYLAPNATLLVAQTSFTANLGVNGGALNARSPGVVQLDNCAFGYNSAIASGGAILFNATRTASEFDAHTHQNNMQITNCFFNNNGANVQDEALAAAGTYTPKAHAALNQQFNGDDVISGGAIAILMSRDFVQRYANS